jgi:hypothetical protein
LFNRNDTASLWRYRLPQDNPSCGDLLGVAIALQRPFLIALEGSDG